MAATTLSIQQFHEDVAAAEAAASAGPVFITENGEPRRVLIDIAEYRKLTPDHCGCEPGPRSLTAQPQRNSELLAMPEEDYFEWDPPRLEWRLRPVDLD